MRVAALYDIHGNLPALEAVIRDMHDARVDHVVVGGDVLPGPMPRETLTGLLDLRIPLEFLSGNGETAVLAELAGTPIARLPEAAREVVRWTAEQLHPQEELFLRSWPATLRVDIPGVG